MPLTGLPDTFETPPSISNPEYTYEWYDANRHIVGAMGPIFSREHIDRFYDLVRRAQDGEIPGNLVLAYIDPRNEVGIEGRLETDNLGYFIDKPANIRAQNKLSDEQRNQLLKAIEVCRWNILSAVGAENPDIQVLGRRIIVEPVLSDGTENVDVVGDYVRAVEAYFDALEGTYDLEQVHALYAYRLEELRYALENEIGRTGGEMQDADREYYEERIKVNEMAIRRLSEKI